MMHLAGLKLLGLACGLAAVSKAHTVMTTFFINGENQGDGVCVRMPRNGQTATNPVTNVESNDIVCGRDGTNPVPFTCAAPAGADITFWWRAWPDWTHSGSIDSSHMGSCAVYLKQTSNMATEKGSGAGWFKIWDEGYDASSKKWCTEKLIDNQGFLTVTLPPGLPRGDYLVRAELLALHESTKGESQFYVNCAQIHVQGTTEGTLSIPSGMGVSIPGFISKGSEGLRYDVWNKPGTDYKTSGPEVFYPTSTTGLQTAGSPDNYGGGVPEECLITNGDWCGMEVPSYSNEAGCWKASQDCWNQNDVCFTKALPMGHRNCEVWQEKCQSLESSCNRGQFKGPPNAGQKLTSSDAQVPQGVSFSAWNTGAQGYSGNGGKGYDAVTESTPVVADNTPATDDSLDPDTLVPEDDGEIYTEDDGETYTEDDGDAYTEDDGSDLVYGYTPPVTDGLTVSTNRKCGGMTGQTCEGSMFGPCCSRRGTCGSTPRHCSRGCLGGFGKCFRQRSSRGRVVDEYNEEW